MGETFLLSLLFPFQSKDYFRIKDVSMDLVYSYYQVVEGGKLWSRELEVYIINL